MTYQLADLRPGDVVHHTVTGFTWRVTRVESVGRMFEWHVVVAQTDLTRINPLPKWSPPHTEEEWHSSRDGEVRRGVRAA